MGDTSTANGRISGIRVSASSAMRSSMPSSEVASTGSEPAPTMLRSTTTCPPRTRPSARAKVAWQCTTGSPRAERPKVALPKISVAVPASIGRV